MAEAKRRRGAARPEIGLAEAAVTLGLSIEDVLHIPYADLPFVSDVRDVRIYTVAAVDAYRERMTEQPKRRGGWPGPRKETAWTFKPDPDAQAAVKRYMEEHRLTGEWGGLTKALNAMLAAKPDTEETQP